MTLIDRFLNSADDCGTVSWFQAVRFVNAHGALEGLLVDYAALEGERIDAGELAVWMGY